MCEGEGKHGIVVISNFCIFKKEKRESFTFYRALPQAFPQSEPG